MALIRQKALQINQTIKEMVLEMDANQFNYSI